MQWFKHDSDASTDARIKKLILRYGPVGYAVYFHCLELIAGDIGESNITFELEHDAEIIADDLKVQGTAQMSAVDLVNVIMRYIVELGLFEEKESHIFCFKMLKRLDSSMTSNPKLRGLIASAKQNHDAVMIESCQNHDAIMLEENRIEETRTEKKKHTRKPKKQVEKKTYGEFQNVRLTDAEYAKYLTELGEPGLNAVIEHLSAYCESQGRDYPSHAGAMRSWVIEEVRKRRPELFKKADKSATKSQFDLDMAAMVSREYAERGHNAGA